MLVTLTLPEGRDGDCWRCEPRGYIHHWHRHAEPELNLVLRGRGTYLLADRRYEIEAGSLVWLFPDQEHRLVDMSPDFAMWIALIDRQVLAQHAGARATLLDGDPAGDHISELIPSERQYLDRLCADLADKSMEEYRFNSGIVYLFLTAWDAHQRADSTAHVRLHRAIDEALRMLDRDPELGADALAEAVGLTRSHFSRLFHQEVGQTLTVYRTTLRLERVRQLLGADDQRQLLAIALEAGFGSYAQFHRAVRKHWGCSPRDLSQQIT